MTPQRLLIILGAALVVLGLAWPLVARLRLGRLPGDLLFRKGGLVFYAPLMTCLVLSVVVSLVFWLMRR